MSENIAVESSRSLTAALDESDPLAQHSAKPFIWAAITWLAIGGAICWNVSGDRGHSIVSLRWMVGFLALSLLDLFATARTFAAILTLVGKEPEKRQPFAVQAFYWGLVKVASLGFFCAVLMRARAIPAPGLILGLGTMIVVPLLGGVLSKGMYVHE